jgi:lipopolysaccharide/colanic/teichoic acid biosynthesis glycosyltransferase
LAQVANEQVSALLRPRAYEAVKQFMDTAGAAVLLLVAAPLLAIIGIAIVADSGFPVIYGGQRLGRNGRPITVLKFRTMSDGAHHHLEELLSVDEERRMEYLLNRKLKDDPRVTRVGAVLRRTSLDELPQLWNVVTGSMSLVGPRPYFEDELADRKEAGLLLSVRPGITGLWQVNGRSDRTFAERLEIEVTYVRHRRLGLDLSIMARTLGAVISGRGAY